jgi:hypothetical protein
MDRAAPFPRRGAIEVGEHGKRQGTRERNAVRSRVEGTKRWAMPAGATSMTS